MIEKTQDITEKKQTKLRKYPLNRNVKGDE